MDNKLIQTVFQINQIEISKRMIVQFNNVDNERKQTINNYDDLTDEQKEVFDAFQELSKSLIK